MVAVLRAFTFASPDRVAFVLYAFPAICISNSMMKGFVASEHAVVLAAGFVDAAEDLEAVGHIRDGGELHAQRVAPGSDALH